MRKVLMVTSVASMIKQFNMSNIRILIDLGYDVTVATNFKDSGNIPQLESNELYNELKDMGVNVANICFDRKPISRRNFKAYRQIREMIAYGSFDLIHCQSPIGGFLTRVAAKNFHHLGTKVIYTAHGFHFFYGAPLKNWIIFFPVEKLLSKYTDTIITINTEDYKRAKRFKSTHIEYIPGVGIDLKKIAETLVFKGKKREEIGIPEKSFVVLSVGELNENKNHEVIIRALAQINDPTIHYVICGTGTLKEKLKRLSKELDISNQVHLLGYRADVIEVYKSCDIFAFPSRREGLGISALEAMACGLPILTSNVHGILDYSKDKITGFNYNPNDIDGFAEGIKTLKNDKEHREKIRINNKEAANVFNIENVNLMMSNIYNKM